MSWNQATYDRGYRDADEAMTSRGLAEVEREYRGLAGAAAVNEYEVGFRTRLEEGDKHGNKIAREGVDRCFCGCKYWEKDRCIDCGEHVIKVRQVQQ